MQTLWRDLRYGIRMLLKKPGFTLIAFFTLAFGIGANTAMFSVVNAVLLRPLPFKDPERLVTLWEKNDQRGKGWERVTVSPLNFADWESQSQVFEQMAAFRDWGFTLTGRGEPEQFPAGLVSPQFFNLLNTQPSLGRGFLPDDNQPGRNQVVLLSHDLWQGRFGSDPNVVGHSITLDGKSFSVIGVLPSSFDFSSVRKVELWAPLSVDPDQQRPRSFRNLRVFARLRSGVPLAQAQTEMGTIARRLEQQYAESNTGFGAVVIPLHQLIVGEVQRSLLLLLGAIGLVLLIACANIANLMLARAAARKKEIAIRTAVGATHGRLVRQLLTESVLLFLIGGACGMLLSIWGKDLLIAFSPGNVPRLKEVRIDGAVLGFSLAVSLLTGILFGLIPALQVFKPDLNEALKEGGRRAAGGSKGGYSRNALVVAEVALSFVLLIGAGLLLKSFIRLQSGSLGFDPHGLLTMRVFPSPEKYSRGRVISLYRELSEQIRTVPGVQSVGLVTSLPLSGGNESINFEIRGRPSSSGQHRIANYRQINADYFRAIGIPLVRGRYFTEKDVADAPQVVIINQTMAAQFFPDEDPLGQRLNIGRDPQQWEVVGVVGDVKHLGPSQPALAEMYEPIDQNLRLAAFFVVRTAADPQNVLGPVREKVRAVDPDLPLTQVATMDQRLSGLIAEPRFNMYLFSIFAAVALALAAAGIYGVMSYLVTQRTHEIGIRLALGARAIDVLKLVVRNGMLPAVVGAAIGLAGAFVLTRFMTSLLFEVTPTDAVTFATVPAVLIGVALFACYVPARRATKVDPLVALRYE
jgi:putative ABC transport system permease protein